MLSGICKDCNSFKKDCDGMSNHYTGCVYYEKEITKQLIKGFNKPHQHAVAINTEHIGDDNDYSCFLLDVIMKLFPIDSKMAFSLYRTDSMAITEGMTLDTFKEHMADCIKRTQEIESMLQQSAKSYEAMID